MIRLSSTGILVLIEWPLSLVC